MPELNLPSEHKSNVKWKSRVEFFMLVFVGVWTVGDGSTKIFAGGVPGETGVSGRRIERTGDLTSVR